MKIEILAVGSELLTPFYQDTNSLYLTQRLNDLGLEVSFKIVVGDDRESLFVCIKNALVHADALLAMGGLGPTADDITREVFAETLGRQLVYCPDIFQKIEARFRRRGLAMPAANKKQAYIIQGSEVLENKNGTAPGLWLEEGRTRIALLPGPPAELKPMFEEFVWPKLAAFQKGFSCRRVIKIAGLTESEVETRISGLYPKGQGLGLTILASPGQIEIHLYAFAPDASGLPAKKIEDLGQRILERLGGHVFSTAGEELEEVVGRLLGEHRKTLAAAESCSGGLLSHRLTNVSGSSKYFLEGLITYSNHAKIRDLNVPEALIQNHGAVSAEVAQAMADGVRQKAGSSFGLAITGIAGPIGGTAEKPVGLVYSALSWEGGVDIIKNVFLGKREQIKFQSTQKALDMLRRHLL
jgi:nicotinamide-nucleotide amidase